MTQIEELRRQFLRENALGYLRCAMAKDAASTLEIEIHELIAVDISQYGAAGLPPVQGIGLKCGCATPGPAGQNSLCPLERQTLSCDRSQSRTLCVEATNWMARCDP